MMDKMNTPVCMNKTDTPVDESRRIALGLGVVAMLSSAFSASAEAAAGTCGESMTEGRQGYKVVRLFTGPDGKSTLEDIVLQGEERHNFKMGDTAVEGFRDLLKKKATALHFVTFPPNLELPVHKTPAGFKEFFFMVQGSSTLITHNDSRSLAVGSVVLTDDTNGSGHWSKTGPEGVTGISVLYTD